MPTLRKAISELLRWNYGAPRKTCPHACRRERFFTENTTPIGRVPTQHVRKDVLCNAIIFLVVTFLFYVRYLCSPERTAACFLISPEYIRLDLNMKLQGNQRCYSVDEAARYVFRVACVILSFFLSSCRTGSCFFLLFLVVLCLPNKN